MIAQWAWALGALFFVATSLHNLQLWWEWKQLHASARERERWYRNAKSVYETWTLLAQKAVKQANDVIAEHKEHKEHCTLHDKH
jgi:hypothetical protein